MNKLITTFIILFLSTSCTILKKEVKKTSITQNNKLCLSYELGQTYCTACVESIPSKEKICDPIINKIDHCIVYDSQTECQFCQLNYTLSDDQTSCIRIKQQNCVHFEKECMACKIGMKVVNGVCVEENKCELENCLLCGNQKNVEQCFICKEGFVIGFEGYNLQFICKKVSEQTKGCGIYYPMTPGTDMCWGCDLGYYQDMNTRECLKSDAYDITKFGN